MASLEVLSLLLSGPTLVAGQAILESTFANKDAPLQVNPALPFCGASRSAFMEGDSFGKAIPRYRTEVRSSWTRDNL
jgi:hypothetical protein